MQVEVLLHQGEAEADRSARVGVGQALAIEEQVRAYGGPQLQLTREVIQVETVPQAQLLEGNVGYVKLSQFSANTTRDLSAAIQRQMQEAGGNLQGLVLDLRGNPGGLLEQAISVSDLFLSEGVIVKTVGEGDRRQIHEVKEAKADRNDYSQLPLVVLVNNASASASEIVAGALKNNGRALVAGRQTFGKGSVQVLYDFSDPAHAGEEAALKLTIAQYLTPGDVSIQEVGITPDVHLQPGRALPDAVNWFAPPRSMGEADLDHHFKNPLLGAEARKGEPRKVAEKPPLELRYLLDEKEDLVAKALKKEAREEARKAGSDDPELTPAQLEDEEADANLRQLVEEQIERESLALFMTGKLYDDGIIDPRDTRRILGLCLQITAEAAARTLRPNTFGIARL